jgi:hypothetical protein
MKKYYLFLFLCCSFLSKENKLYAKKDNQCYCAFKPGPRDIKDTDRPRKVEIFADEIENDTKDPAIPDSQMVCFCKERDIIKFCKKKSKIKQSHINATKNCR